MTGESFPTEWTPEVARALAHPFAAEQIGKLPRGGDNVARDQWTYCKDCKQKAAPRHFHVDYINHAVVTDRLNSVVGPHNWSWSLLTVERDQSGRLLAVVGEMAVLGHTKGPETGTPAPTQKDYGDQLKSAISDYICRAAMRFGVALDLWAKQQLESAQDAKPTAATKESKSGGTGERRGGLEAPTPIAGATANQGEDPSTATTPAVQTEGGTPPDFDLSHLGLRALQAWLRGQHELKELVEEDAKAQGIDLAEADKETLHELIATAWKVKPAA